MMEGTRKEEKVVVVTGATGGTGKRVVKEFVQRGGYRVRVVVRSEERARELFGKEISKRVEFFQSDLYNLHADFFRDASAVISCTGTKIGPTDDSPDREKYYQGVVFYPPVILEDTPENVEYVGVKRLSEKVAESMPKGEKVMDFADSVSIKNMWGVVDDIVMGGVSESSMQVSKDQKGLFQGYVSTANRGGFASVRTRPFEKPLPIDTSATRIILRVKGDGQRYKLNLRTDDKYDGIAFCYSFDTVKDEWIDVSMPFKEFCAVFRAKSLSEPKLDPTNIKAVQIMLSKFEYDGMLNPNFTEGPFKLEIDSISTASDAPRLVHISSAGVTRVLRKDEFPDLENEPPAVRMNEMLGRVLEWKLAGEDAVRQSGMPYLIIRPCALTEEPSAGHLRFAQGDTLKGQVPREDIAKLIFDVVENGTASNLTIEVNNEDCVTKYGQELSKFSKDDMDARSFAPFPFVPQ